METVPTIEFLYWEDCPSHPEAWKLLQEVIAQEGLNVVAERIEVGTNEEAKALRFPGSPTIRVNGTDVDPPGAARMGTALTCRVYILEDRRYSPVPSKAMLRSALASATG